ncbi:MAG TPA: PspA/IM30 family protein [Pirellulales bacterium]
MRLIELFLLRMVLLVGLPMLLAVLVVGPRRLGAAIKRGWRWLWTKRLEPEEILSQVVRQHQERVAAVKRVIEQAETAESDIVRSLKQTEEHVAALDEESRTLAAKGDDTGAREAVYKLNLEKLAADNFREQLAKQCQVIADSRRRRFQLELQLRQYEVGRSILLSQLAEAQEVEQQYAIARHFDPFNAMADWQRAEAAVEEKTANAKALERVQSDIAEAAAANPADIDPAALQSQLDHLRAKTTLTGD